MTELWNLVKIREVYNVSSLPCIYSEKKNAVIFVKLHENIGSIFEITVRITSEKKIVRKDNAFCVAQKASLFLNFFFSLYTEWYISIPISHRFSARLSTLFRVQDSVESKNKVYFYSHTYENTKKKKRHLIVRTVLNSF